jgi:hypothetical protein
MSKPTGDYVFEVVCPVCRRTVDIEATVEAVLKRKEWSGSTLAISMSSKAIPHRCDQEALALDTDTGELKATA